MHACMHACRHASELSSVCATAALEPDLAHMHAQAAILPVVPRASQITHCFGSSTVLWQRLGWSALGTLLTLKAAALAAGTFTFPLWFPSLQAGLRNVRARGRFRCPLSYCSCGWQGFLSKSQHCAHLRVGWNLCMVAAPSRICMQHAPAGSGSVVRAGAQCCLFRHVGLWRVSVLGVEVEEHAAPRFREPNRAPSGEHPRSSSCRDTLV